MAPEPWGDPRVRIGNDTNHVSLECADVTRVPSPAVPKIPLVMRRRRTGRVSLVDGSGAQSLVGNED